MNIIYSLAHIVLLKGKDINVGIVEFSVIYHRQDSFTTWFVVLMQVTEHNCMYVP